MTPAQARELADDELDALIPTIQIVRERRVSEADRRSIARWKEQDMTFQQRTNELARGLRTEAARLDEEFLRTADPRSVQGGAVCELAAKHRSFSNRLFALAKEMGELT